MTANRTARILDFWFGELIDGLADKTHRNRWYTFDSALDKEMGIRFGHLLTTAERIAPASLTAPNTQLAFIVLCDQFSRNIHRGTPKAFAWDHLAL